MFHISKRRRRKNLVCFYFQILFFLRFFTETQKRRKFLHPLRNLRRIFRRRTVANAETVPITSPLSTSSNIDGVDHHHQRNLEYLSVDKREISADGGLRHSREKTKEIDSDMTDYQRSLSEGRLVER